DVNGLGENRCRISGPFSPYGGGRHAQMLPVRKQLADPVVYVEPRPCRCMMCLVGYDFMDWRNHPQASHYRHDAGDRDLSCEVILRGVDGREVHFRPYEVELFYCLPQKLVTVNQDEPLIFRS